MNEQNDLITGIEETGIHEEAHDKPETEALVITKERGVEVVPLIPQDMSSTDRLIMMALEGNVDVEKLKTLIDLKNAEEERGNKREFDRNFALMQAKLPIIKKAKAVKKKNSEETAFLYAPLEDIQRECDPVIAKYRFSYRWKETALDKGKRITMVISGHGHSEESTFDVPEGETSHYANSVQAQGVMTTFGHRYTYVAGFGITLEGQDSDGKMAFEDGVKYAQYFVALDEETDQKEMYRLVTEYVKNLRDAGDFDGAEVIKRYYTQKKKELA